MHNIARIAEKKICLAGSLTRVVEPSPYDFSAGSVRKERNAQPGSRWEAAACGGPMPRLRDQLKTDDSGEDWGNAYQPQRRRRLREQADAERRGTDCSDPGPHRISGPDRQCLEC